MLDAGYAAALCLITDQHGKNPIPKIEIEKCFFCGLAVVMSRRGGVRCTLRELDLVCEGTAPQPA